MKTLLSQELPVISQEAGMVAAQGAGWQGLKLAYNGAKMPLKFITGSYFGRKDGPFAEWAPSGIEN